MICVPVVEQNIASAMKRIAAMKDETDIVELRIDALSEKEQENISGLIAEAKRNRLKVIATARHIDAQGKRMMSTGQQIHLLQIATAHGADYIDIELEAGDEAISKVMAAASDVGCRIIISTHDFSRTPANLGKVHDRIAAHKPDIVKIAVTPKGLKDVVRLTELAKANPGMIAIAMGEYGIPLRILYRRFGMPLMYCAPPGNTHRGNAPGQLDSREMRTLYRVQDISRRTHVFGVIGDPVAHSQGRIVYNTIFRMEKKDAVYVPILTDSPQAAIAFLHVIHAKGVSVTMPHKQTIMRYLDEVDPRARRIGAVNKITKTTKGFVGSNTDCPGAINALMSKTELEGKHAVILGAGGAARAIAFGLKEQGAEITVLNRTVSKAKSLIKDVGRGNCGRLSDLKNIDQDILINTTSIGMAPHEDRCPIDENGIRPGTLVMDAVYRPEMTQLLKAAKKKGCTIVSGVEMYLNQGALQYEEWTGSKAPLTLMRRIIRGEKG
ncbi:MAG: shikimate dehydrogenase [archaeon]